MKTAITTQQDPAAIARMNDTMQRAGQVTLIRVNWANQTLGQLFAYG